MCRSTCPFAPALIGAIAGSVAGAASGAASGWLAYAVYVNLGGRDVQGFAFLFFGTLGMAVGGSAGAVGGLIEGWGIGRATGPAEASAARWGATLAGLWGLQPILWLAFTADRMTALESGLGIAATVLVAGAFAGLLGALASRRVVRAFGVGGPAVAALGKGPA